MPRFSGSDRFELKNLSFYAKVGSHWGEFRREIKVWPSSRRFSVMAVIFSFLSLSRRELCSRPGAMSSEAVRILTRTWLEVVQCKAICTEGKAMCTEEKAKCTPNVLAPESADWREIQIYMELSG